MTEEEMEGMKPQKSSEKKYFRLELGHHHVDKNCLPWFPILIREPRGWIVDRDPIYTCPSPPSSPLPKKKRLCPYWHSESYGGPLDLKEISANELNTKLGKFYCEANPQVNEKKHKNKQHEEYHKNSMKAAVNRHLSDIGRNMDIVKDSEFKLANKLLSGMLKESMVNGTSRPTNHKEIIGNTDLEKVSTYLCTVSDNPIKLRLGVWYCISIHFVSRGLEFHHQLTRESFDFMTDEDGLEYAKLAHETQQKNYQGGLSKEKPMADRRMYATRTSSCPVAMLKKLIAKTDPNAQKPFNQCVKEPITSPELHNIWFTAKSIGKSTFANFLPDICKQAGCSQRYTAHSLRATTIQAMSDAGWETRQIMYMSGHRNEASVRSYSRNMATHQKQAISSTLSALISGGSETSHTAIPFDVPSRSAVNSSRVPSTTCTVVAMPSQSAQTGIESFSQSTVMSSVSSGMLTNSSFSNCSLNFNFSK
ncbi:uncharacterized protein [Argopecten irradians]|uniref:uncharacterized protein n=1 Tax=Argopecten irradians TaxID=31199 RepID=UPI0037202292